MKLRRLLLNKLTRRPCVAGNWKMQGSYSMIETLLGELHQQEQYLQGIDVILCPPFVYLERVAKMLQRQESTFLLGAQNTYCEEKGAYTGEVSAAMLKDVGCQYVIIGHSERRQLFAESDELIARKFRAAYHAGLTPILCLGETQAERVSGQTFAVIRRQLDSVLEVAELNCFNRAMIAYEPVWAIGTGLTATPEQANEVHTTLRGWIAESDPKIASGVRILYGGSVKASNAKELFCEPNVDGGLIGGASLEGQAFLSICHSATYDT